ncbi:MAG: hypothetical protein J6A22_04505 [Bacteroidales bacterium]|nr:hypothetical protein [Bacteroidales bacterium]
MKKIYMTGTVIMITLFVHVQIHAQPKSFGGTYSFNGISAVYEHWNGNDSFIEFKIKADFAEIFLNRDALPGGLASATWNVAFWESRSRNDNIIRAYAGPGIIMGWGSEYNDRSGIVFGFKGNVGLECAFTRGMSISICICPTVGAHLRIMDEYLKMNYYKAGLIYSLLPEIGIKYYF